MMDRFDLEAEREGRAVSMSFRTGQTQHTSRHKVSHNSPLVKRRPKAKRKPEPKKTRFDILLEVLDKQGKVGK